MIILIRSDPDDRQLSSVNQTKTSFGRDPEVLNLNRSVRLIIDAGVEPDVNPF
jgi:hypothetical protein